MGRPSIFPLPDDQARAIIAAADALEADFPPGGNSRAFLAAFIARVHAITGEVYGHGTYRRLLKLYAPRYAPSSVTIHTEIQAFRGKLATRAGRARRYPRPLRRARLCQHARQAGPARPPRRRRTLRPSLRWSCLACNPWRTTACARN